MASFTRQCREVFYNGRVQQVGFRLGVLEVAREFAVCGRAENTGDGRVRLLAEGEPEELEAFLEEVARRLAAFIRETEDRQVSRAPAMEGFTLA